MKTLTHRNFGAVIVLLLFASVGAAQQTTRLVDWYSVAPDLHPKALEIVSIAVDQTRITTGEPFSADEDWLDKLTFRIRNVSNKTVTLFHFGVAFPELSLGGESYRGFSIGYNVKKVSADLKSISPGSEVELTLPADQLAAIRQASTKLISTTHLTRVTILPGAVDFADGSKLGGISLRKD